MLVRLLDHRATPLLLGLIFGLAAVALGLWLGPELGQGAAGQAALVTRWTARAALPLFLITYCAGPWLRVAPGALNRALVRQRRQWGLGFALAHGIHLAALWINLTVFGVQRSWMVIVGGGLAYGFIFLMALTSNAASMRKLGRNWKRLHNVGMHYIWAVFTYSYAGRIFTEDKWVTGSIATTLLLAALALRLYARFGRRGTRSVRQVPI